MFLFKYLKYVTGMLLEKKKLYIKVSKNMDQTFSILTKSARSLSFSNFTCSSSNAFECVSSFFILSWRLHTNDSSKRIKT